MCAAQAETNLVRFGLAAVVLAACCLCQMLRPVARRIAFADLSRDDDERETPAKRQERDESPMSSRAWAKVVFGVVMVTFLTPLITTWTMFVLPLAVAVTLSSLTPIWSLPVGMYHGTPVTTKAAAGAALTCGGVICLAFAVR